MEERLCKVEQVQSSHGHGRFREVVHHVGAECLASGAAAPPILRCLRVYDIAVEVVLCDGNVETEKEESISFFF